MGDSTEWCTVVSKKHQKRKSTKKEIEEDKRKWDVLQKEYPHIIMPARAHRIKKKLNIDGLYDKLISDEWIEYQKKGWKYVKIMKPDAQSYTKEPTIYSTSLLFSTLPICNGWGDEALFCIPSDAEILHIDVQSRS